MKQCFILFFFSFSILSCQPEENCPASIDLGLLNLLDNSVKAFPYKSDQVKLIFSDSLGHEYIGTVELSGRPFAGISGDVPCKSNPEAKIPASGRMQVITGFLSIAGIPGKFSIRFHIFPDFLRDPSKFMADVAFIDYLKDDFALPGFTNAIVIDKRTWPDIQIGSVDYTPTFTIHNKSFKNVYIDKFSNPKYYFTFEEGIIGFRFLGDNKFYKLERIE
ncbi:hypothetical protein [Haliscomenobacter sp.]|uniref:hypothetical protein n=1 Tax=Haliscomenobacter sp. TaxID=2717303 RepID=UPI003BAC4EAE